LVQCGWGILAGVDARNIEAVQEATCAPRKRKTTMKRLLSAAIALTLLGGTAATAAPFHHGPFVPGHAYVQHMPRPHVWIRGERFMMPQRHYIVLHDWHRYHLRRPPVGYRWVRYGNDLLLVSRRSGIILDVRFARF